MEGESRGRKGEEKGKGKEGKGKEGEEEGRGRVSRISIPLPWHVCPCCTKNSWLYVL